MLKILYEIENREATIAQIAADGQVIRGDVTIDLDENGRLTNCYFIADDAPPAEPDLLAQADMTILDITEQLILAKEGLS